MKVGILGSGNVGGTLGSRWAAAGHTVTFASRTPDSAEMAALVAKAGNGARAATAVDTVAGSDVILLATPWPATREILEGAGSLAGKKYVPPSLGTLPTDKLPFALWLTLVILIIGALTFFPALSLGPIVEHLQMIGA